MPDSRTIPALLHEMAARHPDVEFVVGGGQRYSYRTFQAAVQSFARGLHTLGVRPGDKVALLMGNCCEWLIADFAIVSLGGVMVSVNTWASRRELAYMLEHSDTKVLICSDTFLGRDYLALLEEIGEVGQLRHVVRVAPSGRSLPGSSSWTDVMAMSSEADEAAVTAAAQAVQPEDIAYLLYTSGSTSTPKGVQLQHYGLIENMWSIGERLHLRVGDRLWLAVSLFWGLGCENALFALMSHAGTIVLQEHFDAHESVALIEAEACTVIYATPNMVRAMVDLPGFDKVRLATLRTGVTLGTPEQIHLLAELGPAEICNVYGLTESYGNSTVTDAALPLEVRAACVGEPLDNVELVIADPESGQPLPTGEVGEIKLRGYITCGYYKDEDKNAAAFDAEGYFLTGDLGFLDEHNRLHFRGRYKEMIKTGGINVSPVEVEEVLMTHPAVELAFVVGLADEERDEVVAALVVPRKDRPVTPDILADYCKSELAAYKRPRRYLLLEQAELPLTSTGKVRKAAMPAMFSS